MAEYTPTEAEIEDAQRFFDEFTMTRRSGERLAASLARSLAAHDAEVRADERANVDAELAMLRRAGKTLGTQLELAGRAIQEAVNRPDLLNDDGEGDWELVFELLAGLRPRAEVAEQALADERSKRPDREQMEAAVKRGLQAYYDHKPTGEDDPTEPEHLITDAVLSSLALEPEAREETEVAKPYSLSFLAAARSAHREGGKPEAREVPTPELASLRRWKEEATLVLNEWEAVYVAVGQPGRLGASKAESVRDLIASLAEAREVTDAIVDIADEAYGDELTRALREDLGQTVGNVRRHAMRAALEAAAAVTDG